MAKIKFGPQYMNNITFFFCDQMLATSVSLPLEMLKAGESAAQVQDRQAPALQIQSVGLTTEKVKTGAGFDITPDHCLEDIMETDIIFLPALWRNPKSSIRKNKRLLKWLIHHYNNGTIICSVGTGVCFLAETGLLDNKPATTHWYYFDRFQRDYPKIQLKRQYFIVQAGNLYSAASVNSLADLTVYLIQRIYNKLAAMHVERHFSHEIRRSYKSTSYIDGQSHHPDEDIMQTQVWLQDNFNKNIVLSDVAKQFEMSVRSFNRRFKDATGATPLHYLQQVRIETAKDLLKTSNLTIHEISEQVGYQDLAHFNKLFKRLLNTSPNQYRAMVRAKLFSVE